MRDYDPGLDTLVRTRDTLYDAAEAVLEVLNDRDLPNWARIHFAKQLLEQAKEDYHAGR